MKILLSPSKTKTLQVKVTKNNIWNTETNTIVEHLQSMSLEEIGQMLKLKNDKAQELYEFYQNYANEPSGAAVYSYTGLVFKNLDYEQLSDDSKEFAQKHLLIMSALYGLLEPYMPIKKYRLDFIDNLPKYGKNIISQKLNEFWTIKINEYLQDEDLIINLASKEYSSIIEHPNLISLEFVEEKNGELKQLSTSSKIMRGRMCRYILENKITSLSQLPEQLDDFSLISKRDNQGIITYKKI